MLRSEEKWEQTETELTVDGQRVDCAPFVYLMLHKPAGSAVRHGGPGSADGAGSSAGHLLPPGACFRWGRLSQGHEGLLLLTDDGPLGHALLSPKRHVDKVYLARVDGVVDQSDVEALARGMVLGDGLHCLPAGLEPLEDGRVCLVTLREGKYHQVKRMMAARGKPVTYLKRLSMGPLRLDAALAPGEWRPLTREEVLSLSRFW